MEKYRLNQIYTRTGDKGETSLGDGSRVAKSDLRIQVLGEIDELNVLIGIIGSYIAQYAELNSVRSKWQYRLSLIQHGLFDLGGEICIPHSQLLQVDLVEFLEKDMDEMNALLSPLKDFILPAGHITCTTTHHARVICRKVERSLVSLHQRDNNIHPVALQFINRLSDWLFVASRTLQKLTHGKEVIWQKSASS